VIQGDRAVLARAISLVESTGARRSRERDELLRFLLDRTGRAMRIGVTGVPGAGKSTFIERLGVMLCEQGLRVAVLAIDPSSAISGGSILGDRTRMGRLAAHPNAFIRPSPSGGVLGGVARRTREASMVCEAAGYGVVLIETVGVGQSETMVADMVDCVLTLALPGAGDELQGVKRGLLELVDVIALNKADNDNVRRAKVAAMELAGALRVLRGREIAVVTCSAATGEGVDDVWRLLTERHRALQESGELAERRRAQMERWMESLVDEGLRALVENSGAAARELARAREDLREARETPTGAAQRVLRAFVQDVRTRAVEGLREGSGS
jgi:LAO/AO transport system kinase